MTDFSTGDHETDYASEAAAAQEPPSAAAATVDLGPGPLRWRRRSVFHGRNVHHEGTVLCVDLELGELAGRPVADLPQAVRGTFIAQFMESGPVLPHQEPPSSVVAALHEGTLRIEDMLLQAVLALERRAAFWRKDFVTRSLAAWEADAAEDPGGARVRLLWSGGRRAVSFECARIALTAVNDLLAGSGLGLARLQPDLAALERRCRRNPPSTTVAVLLMAAARLGLSAQWRGGAAVQLGEGAFHRELFASAPDDESLGAMKLSQHKLRTAQRLRGVGVRVPRGIVVRRAEAACAAARSLGYPVVVKPWKGHQGEGVTVGATSDEEVAAAYALASRDSERVLVEEFVTGTTYRLLVIDGRFAAALRIDPPAVVGDGRSTLAQLVEQLNADPRRDEVRMFPVLHPSPLPRGRDPAQVLAAGERLPLAVPSNVALGGEHTDVTDLVHPEHARMAELAARAIGLKVAGIDLVSRDISLTPGEARTSVLELNGRPGLCMHMFPLRGPSQDVAGQVLRCVVSDPEQLRLPTALVIGGGASRRAARMIAEELGRSGIHAAVVKRVWPGPAPESTDGAPRPEHALVRLREDPRVEALVVAVSPEDALRRGLLVERADLAWIAAGNEEAWPAETLRQAVALAGAATPDGVRVREADTHVLEACRTGSGPFRTVAASRAEMRAAIVAELASQVAARRRQRPPPSDAPRETSEATEAVAG